jgi:hypothetical protein
LTNSKLRIQNEYSVDLTEYRNINVVGNQYVRMIKPE